MKKKIKSFGVFVDTDSFEFEDSKLFLSSIVKLEDYLRKKEEKEKVCSFRKVHFYSENPEISISTSSFLPGSVFSHTLRCENCISLDICFWIIDHQFRGEEEEIEIVLVSDRYDIYLPLFHRLNSRGIEVILVEGKEKKVNSEDNLLFSEQISIYQFLEPVEEEKEEYVDEKRDEELLEIIKLFISDQESVSLEEIQRYLSENHEIRLSTSQVKNILSNCQMIIETPRKGDNERENHKKSKLQVLNMSNQKIISQLIVHILENHFEEIFYEQDSEGSIKSSPPSLSLPSLLSTVRETRLGRTTSSLPDFLVKNLRQHPKYFKLVKGPKNSLIFIRFYPENFPEKIISEILLPKIVNDITMGNNNSGEQKFTLGQLSASLPSFSNSKILSLLRRNKSHFLEIKQKKKKRHGSIYFRFLKRRRRIEEVEEVVKDDEDNIAEELEVEIEEGHLNSFNLLEKELLEEDSINYSLSSLLHNKEQKQKQNSDNDNNISEEKKKKEEEEEKDNNDVVINMNQSSISRSFHIEPQKIRRLGQNPKDDVSLIKQILLNNNNSSSSVKNKPVYMKLKDLKKRIEEEKFINADNLEFFLMKFRKHFVTQQQFNYTVVSLREK